MESGGNCRNSSRHTCCKSKLLFHNDESNTAGKYSRKRHPIRNRWQEAFSSPLHGTANARNDPWGIFGRVKAPELFEQSARESFGEGKRKWE